MKSNKGVPRVKVSADGRGVVSHAGVGMLREVAESTGLVRGVTNALLDTYRGLPALRTWPGSRASMSVT